MEARQPTHPPCGLCVVWDPKLPSFPSQLSDSVWQSIPFEAERDERNFRKANKVEAGKNRRTQFGRENEKNNTNLGCVWLEVIVMIHDC